MKRIISILLVFTIFFVLPISASAKEVTLNLFYGRECPHCEAEQEYLETLQKEYGKKLKIEKYEVWHNSENKELLVKVKEALGDNNDYVPYTVIGTSAITGFNETYEDEIKELVEKTLKNGDVDAVSYVKDGKKIPSKDEQKQSEIKKIPILGKVNLKEVSLPLLSIILGLVDGFNPCAMWILLFLIAMLVNVKNKKRMLILGLTFLLTSAIMYSLIMTAWLFATLGTKSILLHITSISGNSITILKLLIALVALIVGSLNIRSYIKARKEADGCEVVDDEERTKILAKIKKIAKEKNLMLAVFGIAALAVSVNLVELVCSAGIPLVYTSALVLNEPSILEYIIYILIYIIFFMLDDIVVFIIAYKTMQVTGISTKYSKYAHLIGGIIILLIGLFLIFQSGLF